MCGIVGALTRGRPDLAEAVGAMSARLRHRGPDAAGLWVEAEAGVALGHRRLAVIDLSTAGAQPMASASGRHVLVYNGEIYNHRTLRAELEELGFSFRGHSDTEVLLAGIEAWGLEDTLGRSVGMFAGAVWDRRERRLGLFRDRMGEKPLYLARAPDALLFASELDALAAWPGFGATLEAKAVAAFFRRGYVPAPLAIWREARKLEPGCLLELGPDDLGSADVPIDRARRYWSLRAVASGVGRRALRLSDAEAVAVCEQVLLDAVAGQSIADVPLGIFLSGGVDSALVLALLQRVTGRPARTFTIGFADPGFDESDSARQTARLLGAEHTELRVTAERALATVPRLATVYDEPFADPSQLPTLLVAELARSEVTVVLSGDGADELFGGYDRYLAAARLAPLLAAPAGVRRLVGAAVDALGGGRLERLLALFPSDLRTRVAVATSGDRLRKLAAVLSASDQPEAARGFLSLWADPAAVLLEPLLGNGSNEAPLGDTDALELREAMMLEDGLGWLPDDILVKVDRATMAVSLEARAPFLDHRVVELAWRLPIHQKIRDGRGKWVLRQILARHLPPELVARPKMGFRPPLGAWLRGPLRDWAESLLEPRALRRSGLLQERTVRRCWYEHVELGRERADRIWAVLAFQAWLATRQGAGSGGGYQAAVSAADPRGFRLDAGVAA